MFSVGVLTPSEKTRDLDEHNVKQFGLIVRGEEKQGVILPDLDNIKSAKQQLKVCLKKGGFKVKRFK
ncbi:MAG: AMMECR1 domain-containing protein [Nitrospinales bacterium]|jgi:AMMECR1 domain-containing protein